MSALLLYTTAGCHLCDEAAALLHALPTAVQYSAVEIGDNDALLARYGTHIPVITLGTHELNWPFDATQLLTFISDHT